MSTAVTTSSTISTTFDNNHGADKTQVITNKQFNVPASDPDNLPHKFDVSFPFDVGFPFAGQGSLCWELQVTARTVSITVDYFSGMNANPNLAILSLTALKPGCLATGRATRMGATAATVAMGWPSGTGTLRVTGTNALDSGLVITAVGTSNTNWSGIPLPFLIPGSDTAPSGACNLYNDVFLLQVTVASTAGATTTDVPVPATPALHGLVVRSQNWCIDAMANPIGVVTSNAVIHQWLAPYGLQPVSRVYLSGLGATGALGANNGLVTQFN
jgi:hypothetical protein